MKKGTKITVFIASMVITVGSLFAFVGPRRGCHEKYWQGNYNNGSCGQWHTSEVDSIQTN